MILPHSERVYNKRFFIESLELFMPFEKCESKEILLVEVL